MSDAGEIRPFSVGLRGSAPLDKSGLEELFASAHFKAFADLAADPVIVVSPEGMILFTSTNVGVRGTQQEVRWDRTPFEVFLRKSDWELDEFVAAAERGQMQGVARRRSTGKTYIASRRILLFEGSSRGFTVYWLRDPEGWETAKRGAQSRVLAPGDPGEAEELSFPKDLKLKIDQAKKAYARSFRVLLLGPSGVGKTAVAKHLHLSSGRSGRPFVHVNCGSIPESLFESEMFGYERGAFTGALQAGKRGYIESAAGGTLFLDEVGEIPLSSQAKLLKFLEDGSIHPVGSAVSKKIETRVITATNRDLHAMMSDGLFRKDLYFRLSTFPVQIPPLKERTDKEQVLNAMLAATNKARETPLRLTEECRSAIITHSFPGNLRELKSIVEYLDIVAGNAATLEDLPESLKQAHAVNGSEIAIELDERKKLKDLTQAFEHQVIQKALQKYGSKREAARHLGVDIATIVRKTTR